MQKYEKKIELLIRNQFNRCELKFYSVNYLVEYTKKKGKYKFEILESFAATF